MGAIVDKTSADMTQIIYTGRYHGSGVAKSSKYRNHRSTLATCTKRD